MNFTQRRDAILERPVRTADDLATLRVDLVAELRQQAAVIGDLLPMAPRQDPERIADKLITVKLRGGFRPRGEEKP